MPIDQSMLFSSAQAVTNAAISANVIDLGAARHFGVGPRPLYLDARVTTQFADTGNNSTLDIIVQSSPYVGINSSITNTTVGYVATNAAVGDRPVGFPVALPAGNADKQYLALYYSPVGGDFSAGAITAWITADPDLWDAKPVGYTGPTTA